MLIESIRLKQACFMPCIEREIRLEADTKRGGFRLFLKERGLIKPEHDPYRWLGDEDVAPLLKEICQLNPGMSGLDGLTGCDGETFVLTISSGASRVRFEWWCEPPEGWEPLAKIAEMLEDLCPPEWEMIYPPMQGGPA
ncbi:MAG: hypothetical protein Q9M23_02110 [Mariprofundaceae bacterium]|nr:hypothetical protein [Mariprofundaceae bacterium]